MSNTILGRASAESWGLVAVKRFCCRDAALKLQGCFHAVAEQQLAPQLSFDNATTATLQSQLQLQSKFKLKLKLKLKLCYCNMTLQLRLNFCYFTAPTLLWLLQSLLDNDTFYDLNSPIHLNTAFILASGSAKSSCIRIFCGPSIRYIFDCS